MFLLACGRDSVSAPELEPDLTPRLSYETFLQHHAPVKDKKYFVASPAATLSVDADVPDEHDDDVVGVASQRLRHEYRSASVVQRPSAGMSNYDSISSHFHPTAGTKQKKNAQGLGSFGSGMLFGSGSSALRPSKSLQPDHISAKNSAADLDEHPAVDELPIPDQHAGLYQFFCHPSSWSPAFASPGDFTVKMDRVQLKHGQVVYSLALICCCCVRLVRDAGARTTREISKRKSFVAHIERTQAELEQFFESMTLRYIGHRLSEKLPRLPSHLFFGNPSASTLDEAGEAVVNVLCSLLSLSETGFNRLVTLTEPVVRNVLVREFLGLSLGGLDPALMATSSCDARIERQDQRPLLPSAWLGVMDSATSNALDTAAQQQQSRSCYQHTSPRAVDDLLSRSFTRLDYTASDVTPDSTRRHHRQRPSTKWGTGKCIRFVPPNRWCVDKFGDGVFTVEITSVSVVDHNARFVISVLHYLRGRLEVSAVERRYSEFCQLTQTLDHKLPSLRSSELLPAKTLFRCYTSSYLEQRAALLQTFLEKFLQQSFLGVVDQEVPVVAEPNVRKFLQLPCVEWTLVPWNKDTSAVRTTARRRSSLTAGYAMSPMDTTQFPGYDVPTPCSASQSSAYDCEPFTPRYQSIGRRRSDSM
ncbi:TPA: hypothetical protein N0F65_003359 [Lagenidium giganteum]|uniref:PX domain-containing protein n=1 Tax=Lagenidium giganteum TaxID=4803 RepID=A0AAV2Z8P7_9STRA|nr:TPA: hypothetical protein N0F65_003359 [Lagenidium giganteum]